MKSVPGASTIFAGHTIKIFSTRRRDRTTESFTFDWYLLNLEETVLKFEIAQTVREISNF
jgi:hypothetical protein